MWRSSRLGLSTIVVAFFELMLQPCAVRAQDCPCSSGACDQNVLLQFKLVSPGRAWAIVEQPIKDSERAGDHCTASHLYFTDNNGQSWRDLTPRSMPTRSIGQVFFLDRSHVWMLSTDALDEQAGARFYLLSSEDAGRNWRTLVLERPMFHLMDDYYFPQQLFFVDAQHGWILWQWHMMNSTQDALLVTNDGGRTWKRLANPPGAGPLQFLTPLDGWMIGGPEDWRGVARPENTQLWITRDGGANWEPVAVPVPLDSPEQRLYLIAFKFNNMNEGMVAAGAQEIDSVNQRYTNCYTSDGGKTWRFSRFEALSAGPSIGDKHIFWCVGHRDTKKPRLRWTTLQKDTDPISLAMPERFSNQIRQLLCVQFIDEKNGWVRASVEGRTKIIVTTDGGETSKFMPLPLTTIK